MLKIERLSVEYSTKPIVTDESHPVFSFALSSDQNGVEISRGVIKVGEWSKTFKDERLIRYDGVNLIPFTKYEVVVEVEAINGDKASANLTFETGYLGKLWRAKWISDPTYEFKEKIISPKVLAFRKKILLKDKPIKSIKLYSTALGIYDVYVNEKLASDRYFSPGFTSYKHNLAYQTLDLTDKIHSGDDLHFLVAGGWAIGAFVMNRVNRFTYKKQVLLAELRVVYEDEEVELIHTDDSWEVTHETQYDRACIYDGEIFDARLSFKDLTFHKVNIEKINFEPTLRSDYGVKVVLHEEFKPLEIKKLGEKYIIDFGQNFAGLVSFQAKNLKKGQKITIRHAEVLKKDGSLNTDFLRTARAEIVYIAKGEEEEIYSPRFTYMGFRYISVEGINIDDIEIKANAIYSDIDIIGEFSCSNEMINKLQSNIMWSSKSNFVDIPTDCPQRDERMGWTGDINVFSKTAYFNFDMTRFLKKWLLDVKSEQLKTGGVPNAVPANGYGFPTTMPVMAIDFWGDAIVNVPYNIYEETGDIEIIKSMYENAKKYAKAEYFWAKLVGFGDHRYIFQTISMLHFGDWIAPDCDKMSEWQARHKWTATASLKLCSDKVKSMASLLKKEKDIKYFDKLSNNTSRAYINVLTDGNGKLDTEFQTGYVLPLYFDIFKGETKLKAAKNLSNLVAKNDYCIGTGFPGTPYILFALCDNGEKDTAFKMLLNTKCPSWLYEVKVGATTIWEKWDGLKENGETNLKEDGTGGMISFNHYASGAVGDFLYRRIAGIELIEPGYKKFKIQPILGGNITFAKASTYCLYGKISSSWKIENDEFTIDVEVPIGTNCDLIMPSGNVFSLVNGKHTFKEKI